MIFGRMANFTDNNAVNSSDGASSGIAAYVRDMFDASLTWADVRWLVKFR